MDNITRLRPYERHAWLILFLLWALHLVLSARDFIPSLQDVCVGCLPGALTPIQASTGMTWVQLLATDPKVATYLASILVDDGISGVLVAVFGMVVTFTSYRKGEKWAWYLSWSNPIGILTAQFNLYLLTGSILVIVLAAIFVSACLFGLFLPYRKFFPRKRPIASRYLGPNASQAVRVKNERSRQNCELSLTQTRGYFDRVSSIRIFLLPSKPLLAYVRSVFV